MRAMHSHVVHVVMHSANQILSLSYWAGLAGPNLLLGKQHAHIIASICCYSSCKSTANVLIKLEKCTTPDL